MKNLTTLLHRGNLSPKERVQLWITNTLKRDDDGKGILNEADIQALARNWKPKDNNEVREYNKWNDGWTLVGYARLDAQTIFLNTEILILRITRLLDHVIFKNEDNVIEECKRMFDKTDADEKKALGYLLAHVGFEMNQLVYDYAYEHANEELKQDLLALDPDAETESQYMDQEEEITLLFNGKKVLSPESKERMAEAILAVMFNKYAGFARSMGLKKDDWQFDGYYAEIPAAEILKKWAEYNHINIEITDKDLKRAEEKQEKATHVAFLIAGDTSLDEELRKEKLQEEMLSQKIKEYADRQNMAVGTLLKETIVKWLDNGLFVKEFVPMCMSKEKNTCNGKDTKRTHDKVLKAWLEKKEEANATIQALINNGDIAVEERQYMRIGVTDTLRIITGESLHESEADIPFIAEAKKQILDFLPIARFIVFLREDSFMNSYQVLVQFRELFKRLSRAYDIEIGNKVNGYVASIEEEIYSVNREVVGVIDHFEGALYKKYDTPYHLNLFFGDTPVSLDAVAQDENEETILHYRKEFVNILGSDF